TDSSTFRAASIQSLSDCWHPICRHASHRFLSLCHLPLPTETYTLSLHDALPISSTICHTFIRVSLRNPLDTGMETIAQKAATLRSEEHTSELQSRENLVCRLLLEKKKER